MRTKIINKLFLSIFTGTIFIMGSQGHVQAADDVLNTMPVVPIMDIENIVEKNYQMDIKEDVQLYLVENDKGEYLNIAFSNVSDFAYIRYAATEKSDWAGKMYPGTAVEILDYTGDWVRIKSGNVYGYVQTKDLLIGKEAKKYDESNGNKQYHYAESKVEEEERLAKEAALKKGEEVIAYGSQFIGNPYVWGGTSLLYGADCSGFVQAVYADFGISLPRTTWDMESVGVPVSYDQAMPGDLILYDGHVGLYAGNDMILNAVDESQGIRITSALYAPIVTVRRVL